MKLRKTHIEDLIVIEPKVFNDDRGYFFESFNENELQNLGLNHKFIQDNEALSSFGVLRGLHYQKPPFSQTKLIRVIKGEILDVVVDLRKHSPTFGETFSIHLNELNKFQLLVPKGFAHGYLVLSKEAIVSYKVDEKYLQSAEDGIVWNDKDLNIDWQIEEDKIVLSERDKRQNKFKLIETPFI